MLPSARRVAVLVNAADPVFAKSMLEQVQRAGSGTGTEIIAVTVRGPDELEAGFARAVKEKADAVVYQASLPTKRMVDLALAHRLPTATTLRVYAEIGGLIAYGSEGPALYRRAAAYIDKILKGAKPGDIPVEQPTTFDFVVNMKTAKALGIKIPNSIMVRATKVIE